jgi:RIO kinase 1
VIDGPIEIGGDALELVGCSAPSPMNSQLDLLLSEGIISEVLGRLKSGKEAEVFRVVYRGNIVAAKVYKDRQQRSFQHNVAYKEGRKVRNSRTQRAIDKGSRFGRDEAEDAWKSSEANTLQLLHRQGVRVPTPVLFYEGVLLMELVSDADGDTAPRLIEAAIDAENAGPLYRDLRSQIIKVLCCDLIHGDLSPYNVLLGVAGPTIIDFPQAISAAHNSQSEGFFQRDFENIHSFFAEHDRRLLAARGDGREIWRAYTRRDLSPDFIPMTRPPAPPPRPQQQGGYNDQRQGGPRYNSPRSGDPRFNDQRPIQPRVDEPRFDDRRPAQPRVDEARVSEQRSAPPPASPPRFDDRRPAQPRVDEPRVNEQRSAPPQVSPPRFDDQRPAQAAIVDPRPARPPISDERPSPPRGPRPAVSDRFAEERPKDHRNDAPRGGGQQRGGDQRGGGGGGQQRGGGDQRGGGGGGQQRSESRSSGQRHPGPRQFDQAPSEQRPIAAQPPAGAPTDGARSTEWPSRPRVYEPPAGAPRPPPAQREATAPDAEGRPRRTRSRRR